VLVAAAVFAALGVLLIARRSTWARDVVQLHWFSQRTSERVIVALGVALLAAAAVAAAAALTA
jgi:hypothetical protein